jgi:hypothetical protein
MGSKPPDETVLDQMGWLVREYGVRVGNWPFPDRIVVWRCPFAWIEPTAFLPAPATNDGRHNCDAAARVRRNHAAVTLALLLVFPGEFVWMATRLVCPESPA